MRKPKLYSASNIKTFFNNREEYYLKYLSDNKVRDPQTVAMACGSAFDARVKAYLHKRYISDGDPAFELETLFEAQVEEHNRDVLWKAGKDLFELYRDSGALSKLCEVLDKASYIMMENKLIGEVFGVPFVGYPDLFFKINNQPVILDWKCNGWFDIRGNRKDKPHTPNKYYHTLYSIDKKTGSYGTKRYKDTDVAFDPVIHCTNHHFDETDDDWCFQMMIYHWLIGVKYDERPLIWIEQLCGGKQGRVASICGRASDLMIEESERRIRHVYDVVNNTPDGGFPHIFENLTKDENDRMCESLDRVANDELHAFFMKTCSRPTFKF